MIKENKAKTTHQTAIVKAPHFGINIWFTGLMAICLWAAGARAQTSPFDGMAFQSYLVDSNGAAISGNKQLKFSIYDTDSGGNLQWAETQTVTVSNGNFSVILGEGTWDNTAVSTREPLGNVFDGSDRYIEIAVDGVTLAPRLRLLPSPYTFRALTADKLSFDATSILEVNATGTTAKGTLEVRGASTLNGALEVTGASTLKGNLTVGEANAQKNVTAHGTLSVTGATTLSSATASGTITADKFEGDGTMPLRGIIMWSGTTAPDGWALCDGGTYHGQVTPNLQGRFIVGIGSTGDQGTTEYNLGLNNDVGKETVKLKTSEIPAHTHKYTQKYINNARISAWPGSGGKQENVQNDVNEAGYGYSAQTSTVTGGGLAHENRPPFYALAYIMRVQ